MPIGIHPPAETHPRPDPPDKASGDFRAYSGDAVNVAVPLQMALSLEGLECRTR